MDRRLIRRGATRLDLITTGGGGGGGGGGGSGGGGGVCV